MSPEDARTDAADRLDYLAETADLLWPGGGARRSVLPSSRTPRLLVPVRPRRAAASALLRYTAQQGRRERAGGLVLAAAAGAGLCTLLPPHQLPGRHTDRAPGTIDDHLAAVLGRPVVTVLALTGRRANRKPVLQVFDGRGRTLAFAKIGTDATTRALVDAEAATLHRLSTAGLRRVAVPSVLHHGSWNATRVLVMTALDPGLHAGPVTTSAGARATLLDEAMHEVSEMTGPGSPAGPGYVATTRAAATRAAAAARAGERVAGWLGVFDEVTSSVRHDDLRSGAWHGDWTDWNCSVQRRRVGVWDWERAQVGVPVGFDKLHLVLNRAVGPRRDNYGRAARHLIDAAPQVLARWGLEPEQAAATALLYVLHLALRYVADGAPVRTAGSRVEQWAYPAVRAAVAARAGVGG